MNKNYFQGYSQNYQNKKLKPTNKDCIGLKYKKQQLQK